MKQKWCNVTDCLAGEIMMVIWVFLKFVIPCQWVNINPDRILANYRKTRSRYNCEHIFPPIGVCSSFIEPQLPKYSVRNVVGPEASARNSMTKLTLNEPEKNDRNWSAFKIKVKIHLWNWLFYAFFFWSKRKVTAMKWTLLNSSWGQLGN